MGLHASARHARDLAASPKAQDKLKAREAAIAAAPKALRQRVRDALPDTLTRGV